MSIYEHLWAFMSIYEHFEHAQNSALHEIRTLVLICQPWFLRNRGRWFRISTSFLPQTSSFGDICILPPSEICTRSIRTSWSCTPWSQFFYSNFFSKFFIFLFIMFMRVYVGYLLLRVYVGYLLLRVYIGYLLWGCM